MKIGIIGGGQLALMMIQENPEHQYIVLEPNKNCSIKGFARQIISAYDDPEALKQLHEETDVITYEFENIPSKSLKLIEDKLKPNSEILLISQNRILEKKTAQKLGLKTTKFYEINSFSELKKIIEENPNKKFILKTTTLGYDGKGQFIIHSLEDLNVNVEHNTNTTQCILEEFLDFDFEISVIGSRDKFGKFISLPITTNTHKNNILYKTNNFSPLNFPVAVAKTKEIMEKLDVIGTLCVEYFVLKNGEIVFNELAPRPHNSGHWSIEGATISQFKNHINAVSGQEVVESKNKHFTQMVNLLGDDIKIINKLDVKDNVAIHDYFKDQIKNQRKMGHITITTDTIDENKKILDKVLKR